MGVGNKPLMDIGGSNTITDRSVSVPDNSKHHFEPKQAQLAEPDPNQAQKIWTRSEPDPNNLDQIQKNLYQIPTQRKNSGPDPNQSQIIFDQIRTSPEKFGPDPKLKTQF